MYSTCLITTAGHPWNGSVFLCAVVRRTNASNRSVVVVGRSMNSRAPERIALTITCGCDMLPMAKSADFGTS